MLKSAGLLAALVLGFVLAAAPALADPYRYPAAGSPAVTMERPDGWTDDPKNGLLLYAADHSGFVQVNFGEVAESPDYTDEKLATMVFDKAGVTATGSPDPVTVDGHKGRIFHGTAVIADHPVIVNMMFLRLDPTHLAAVNVTVAASATPDQTKALWAVVKSMRFAQ